MTYNPPKDSKDFVAWLGGQSKGGRESYMDSEAAKKAREWVYWYLGEVQAGRLPLYVRRAHEWLVKHYDIQIGPSGFKEWLRRDPTCARLRSGKGAA